MSIVYAALALASALAPEVAFDTLNVHLPYARAPRRASDTLCAQQLDSSMPALPLMSYITAFLFSGLPLAKLFNVVCYLGCGGVTYWFVADGGARFTAPPPRSSSAGSPIALYEATTAMVELPLTLYSAVAVFGFLSGRAIGNCRISGSRPQPWGWP